MSDNVEVRMKITFSNGTEENYSFPRQSNDEYQVAKHIKEAMSEKFLAIELENKLQLIPFHNVVSIEVTPPPVKLPAHCLKGVKLI